MLEPAKPIAAYLVGTGHCVLGLAILAIAEILKLVFIERLFSVSRDKLLSIPAFAWGYGKYSAAKARLTSLEAWRVATRWVCIGAQRDSTLGVEAGSHLRPHALFASRSEQRSQSALVNASEQR